MQSEISGSSCCLRDHKSLCELALAQLPFPLHTQYAVDEGQGVGVAVVVMFVIPRRNTSLVQAALTPSSLHTGSISLRGTRRCLVLPLKYECSWRVVLSSQGCGKLGAC